MGRDQRTKRIFGFCPKEITVNNRYESDGLKIIQTCGNLKAGVSGGIFSTGFFERSLATADRIVPDLIL